MEQEDWNYDPNKGKDFSDLSDDGQSALNKDSKNWNTAEGIRGNDGYNPRALSEAENSSDSSSGPNSLSEAENSASSDSPWTNKVGGGSHQSRNSKSQAATPKGRVKNAYNKLKGKGPAAAILGGLGIGGALVGVVGGGMVALLPIHVGHIFKDGPSNMRNPMVTIGVQKSLGNKLSNKYTAGCTSSLSLKCKFKTVSDKTITKLEKKGITVNTEGVSKFSKRNVVTSFEVNGKTINDPQKMVSILNNDASTRSKFNLSIKSRLMTYADSKFSNVKKRFGWEKNPFREVSKKAGAKVDDFKKATSDKIKNSAGLVEPVRSNFDSDAEFNTAKERFASVDGFVKKTKKIARGVNHAIELYCASTAISRVISTGVKAARIAQLTKFASDFLSLSDKLKAGDATPAEVEYLGNSLTSLSSLSEPVDNGGDELDSKPLENTAKSATDSQFYRWYAYGESSGVLDTSSSKFTIGSWASSLLSGFINFTGANLFVSKAACNIVNSAAYDIIEGVGSLAALTNPVGIAWIVASTLAVSSGIKFISQQAITALTGQIIPEDFGGQDLGNALSSGAGAMMSETAQAGGGSILTKNDAIAYREQTNQILAQQAEEDRLNLSPLDPTSKNTFVGSMIFASLPIIGSSNISSGLLSFSSVVSKSFASLLPSASAVDKSKLQEGLTNCGDEFYRENGMAAGPDCVLQRGVETTALSTDIDIIIDSLITSGDLQSELPSENSKATDAIVKDSNLSKYNEYCVERETPIGDDTSDGGFFGIGTIKNNDWYTGKNCLYNSSGNDAQQKVNYYSAFMNYVSADEILEEDPDEDAEGSQAPDDSDSSGLYSGDAKQIFNDYFDAAEGGGDMGGGLAEECTGLSGWFAMQADGTSSTGNGQDVAANLIASGWKSSDKPIAGSVFSYSSGAFGHTGVIAEVNDDGSFITVENNMCAGSRALERKTGSIIGSGSAQTLCQQLTGTGPALEIVKNEASAASNWTIAIPNKSGGA